MPKLISQKELAERLGVHRHTIRKWVRVGILPPPVISSLTNKHWTAESLYKLGETRTRSGDLKKLLLQLAVSLGQETTMRLSLLRRLEARSIARYCFILSPDADVRKLELAEQLRLYGCEHDSALSAIEAVQAGNDQEAHGCLVRMSGRACTIDVATIILIIKLVLMLWDWWNQMNLVKPSVVAQADEPGHFHLEDDVDIRAIVQ
jgi:hypothetical protein